MNLGYLDTGDTLITTRLILGMIISATYRGIPLPVAIVLAIVALLFAHVSREVRYQADGKRPAR